MCLARRQLQVSNDKRSERRTQLYSVLLGLRQDDSLNLASATTLIRFLLIVNLWSTQKRVVLSELATTVTAEPQGLHLVHACRWFPEHMGMHGTGLYLLGVFLVRAPILLRLGYIYLALAVTGKIRFCTLLTTLIPTCIRHV